MCNYISHLNCAWLGRNNHKGQTYSLENRKCTNEIIAFTDITQISTITQRNTMFHGSRSLN